MQQNLSFKPGDDRIQELNNCSYFSIILVCEGLLLTYQKQSLVSMANAVTKERITVQGFRYTGIMDPGIT